VAEDVNIVRADKKGLRVREKEEQESKEDCAVADERRGRGMKE